METETTQAALPADSAPDIDDPSDAPPLAPPLGPPLPPPPPIPAQAQIRMPRRGGRGGGTQVIIPGTRETPRVLGTYAWDQHPDYMVKLSRLDPMTGARSEIGAFHSRPRADIYNPMAWIPPLAGGGSFIISVYRPGTNFTNLLHEFTWGTPGDPKLPPWLQQPGQQPNPMAPFGGPPGYPPGYPQPGMPGQTPPWMNPYQYPWASPWAMQMGMGMQQPVKDNGEVLALRSELAAIRSELSESLAVGKQRDWENAFKGEMAEVRRQIAEIGKPKTNTVDTVTALAAALSPMLTQLLSNSATKDNTTVTMMQAQIQQVLAFMQTATTSQKDEMRRTVELLVQGRDPGKVEQSVGAMANMVTGIMGRMIQMAQMQSSSGPPWYGEVLGDLLEGLKEWVPQLGLMALAKKDPDAANEIARSLSGGQGQPPPRVLPPEPPARALPPQRPAPQPQAQPVAPPQPVAVPRAPQPVQVMPQAAAQPAPAIVQAPPAPPPPAVEAEGRKVPTSMIRKFAQWFRAGMPPEELVRRLAEFIAFCYRFESVPKAWEAENWWKEAIAKPVRALTILWERVGEDVSVPEAYAKALDEAGTKLAAHLAAGPQDGTVEEGGEEEEVDEDDEEDEDEEPDTVPATPDAKDHPPASPAQPEGNGA